MDRKATNILEGEASESDDEETSGHVGFVQNTMVVAESKEVSKVQNDGPSSGVVVSGEASESDDDEDESTANMMLTRNFPALVSQQGLQEFEIQDDCSVSIQEQKQPFESPFHRGIYERNFALRLGIARHHLEQYEHVHNKLKNIIPYSSRSQNQAQETLKNYRHIAEGSKQLNDNLELLLRQTDLPRLKDPFPTI